MRLGLVGYGTGGQHCHAPFIEAAERVELAGVVARAPATIAKVEADLPGTLVLEAIAAGLHVIADKPFAPSADAARELAAAAKAKGVVLGVYHNRRFDADIRTLRKVITDGRLGRVWRVHSRMDFDDPATLEAGPIGACCAISGATSSIRCSGCSSRLLRWMPISTWSSWRKGRPTSVSR